VAWKRKAARIVLIDPAGRVFLQHSRDPGDRSKGSWWELPGGGIEGGETTAEAANRELWEECGLRADEIGPVLWTRQVQFTFAGIAIDQHETVHVGWIDVAGEWKPKHLEALEALAFQDARWWEVDELAESGVRTIPDDLVDWLRRLPARA
jgi:8-oxo-dGTP pyrophosphatase MutT (NUDIX family)